MEHLETLQEAFVLLVGPAFARLFTLLARLTSSLLLLQRSGWLRNAWSSIVLCWTRPGQVLRPACREALRMQRMVATHRTDEKDSAGVKHYVSMNAHRTLK
jgi:hypothetical protein